MIMIVPVLIKLIRLASLSNGLCLTDQLFAE
jgi:hypothetical protein